MKQEGFTSDCVHIRQKKKSRVAYNSKNIIKSKKFNLPLERRSNHFHRSIDSDTEHGVLFEKVSTHEKG